MRELFYSTVCDTCNPPGTSMYSKAPTQTYEGWFGARRYSPGDIIAQGRDIYVFQTKQGVIDEFGTDVDIFQVLSEQEIEYGWRHRLVSDIQSERARRADGEKVVRLK